MMFHLRYEEFSSEGNETGNSSNGKLNKLIITGYDYLYIDIPPRPLHRV